MNRTLPAYYSGLTPFREAFDQGNPILTYHKLGPRPARVRLKGLYISEQLFARQLNELRAAGFTSGSLADCAGPRQGDRVLITFDDGYVNVLRYGLGPLASSNFTAIQFLVAGLLGRHNEWDVPQGEAPEPMMDAAQVRDWLAAGHDIGSHTMTHPFLAKIPRQQAREEITASRKKLEDLFGRPVVHFCYPYGDWSPEVRDLVAEAGYATASTTESGINDPATDRFALRRFTARYPSRNLKAIWFRLRG
jgi:peptidoglycan/xylan/chitin deacetylase (PgdA/CDA1 family)